MGFGKARSMVPRFEPRTCAEGGGAGGRTVKGEVHLALQLGIHGWREGAHKDQRPSATQSRPAAISGYSGRWRSWGRCWRSWGRCWRSWGRCEGLERVRPVPKKTLPETLPDHATSCLCTFLLHLSPPGHRHDGLDGAYQGAAGGHHHALHHHGAVGEPEVRPVLPGGPVGMPRGGQRWGLWRRRPASLGLSTRAACARHAHVATDLVAAVPPASAQGR